MKIRTILLLLVLPLVTGIWTVALAQSKSHTWYDGGSEFGGYVIWKPDCPKSDESPSETYKQIQGNTGEEPELTDQGDKVTVKAADGEVYYYFRTKTACEKYVSKMQKENQEQKKQQRDFDKKYD